MLTIPENIKKGQGALAPGQLKDFSEDYGQAIENSFVVVSCSSCKLLCQVAPSVQQWTCNGIHQDHGLPSISRRDQDHSR